MRLHRLLLRLYPKSFRSEYGGEIRRVFARRRRDATGTFAVVGLWVSEILDTTTNATRVHLDILSQDLRYSLRAFRRAPGFFVAAVSVTALGIGATTASFTLTDHVLLKPLPFPQADRLVKIYHAQPNRPLGLHGLGGTNEVSPANFRDWQQLSTSFSGMAVFGTVSSNLVGGGDPERLAGAIVSAGVLEVVGVAPAAGRALTPADDLAGAPCAVLIADGFWRRRFHGDHAAIGQTIFLDDEPCEVAGVMPRGFEFPQHDTAFWRPIRLGPDSYTDRGDTYLRVIARLKPGVTLETAAADMARISAQLSQRYPDNKDVAAALIPLRDELTDQSRLLVYSVAGASACLLLTAITNLASLFLARASARARELAVRSALGAGSERLVRQLVTDSLVIAVTGGIVGLFIALNAVPLIVKLVPTALPIPEIPSTDLRMLAIAAAGTLVTVLACGVLPALRTSRQATTGALRDGVRAGTSRRTERVRSYLVVAQVAASVALLVCAGLLLRALWRVQAIDTGFNTTGVLTMRLNLPWSKYALNEQRMTFYRRVSEDVNALPGVAASGFASNLPLTRIGGVWEIYLPGRPIEPGGEAQMALSRFVTPGYLDALGIPLLQGRGFDDRDTLRGHQTAIVSKTFGDALWPGQSPLGRHFVVMRAERTIVGVVAEIKVRGIERRNEPQLYLPSGQQPDSSFINYVPRDLAVKTTHDLNDAAVGALTAGIRGVVAKADPQLPISDVRPLTEIVSNDTATRSVQANVLRAFAIVACFLAGVGLHGLLAFMVAARTRDIGVRIALGAERRDILAMVIARGLRLGCIGGMVGLGVGYLAGRSFNSMLAGIDPADALTMGAAVALAIAMTLAGSVVPALRAARTDPMTATRME